MQLLFFFRSCSYIVSYYWSSLIIGLRTGPLFDPGESFPRPLCGCTPLPVLPPARNTVYTLHSCVLSLSLALLAAYLFPRSYSSSCCSHSLLLFFLFLCGRPSLPSRCSFPRWLCGCTAPPLPLGKLPALLLLLLLLLPLPPQRNAAPWGARKGRQATTRKH